MRKIILVGTLAAAFLASCDNATAPRDMSPANPLPLHGVTLNEPHAPFQFLVATCEEDVIGSGVVHALATETFSAAGDSSMTIHFNARGTGVGVISGARYLFRDAFNTNMHTQGELPIVATVRGALKLIGAGSAADLHISVTFHITVNANGDITATVDDFRQRCG